MTAAGKPTAAAIVARDRRKRRANELRMLRERLGKMEILAIRACNAVLYYQGARAIAVAEPLRDLRRFVDPTGSFTNG
jgi:hypothetical protein